MRLNHKKSTEENYLKDRSISEPDILFDKSAITANRLKSEAFPFEYISVDDLHYYRRKKPCNCTAENLFESNFSLFNKSEPAIPYSANKTEYNKSYTRKPLQGKLAPLKRPLNLTVDAYPFLTGNYRSEPSIAYKVSNYTTEYERNYPQRPFSPRIGPLRRATTLKLSLGVMDAFSEQKSQYIQYSNDVISRARPKAIIHPSNLRLSGEIQLFPEYRSAFVPYSLENIAKSNKHSYCHPKRDKTHNKKPPLPPQEMPNHNPLDAKIRNNNYGVSCQNRYHEKLDAENQYLPEYRSKFSVPANGAKSSIIPQHSNFKKYDQQFGGTSEYNNRYKSYDHFTKSAPIKKQDNLNLNGSYDMRPEYKERYPKIDMDKFEKRLPFKQSDNLHTNGSFSQQKPEYTESYRNYNIKTLPERAKPKQDFLYLGGEMQYTPEYQTKYLDFPRQRPIIKKPLSSIRLSSNRQDVKVEDQQPPRPNPDLPIALPYHGIVRRKLNRMSSEEEEMPLHMQPEYRKAIKNYLIKERSPSRGGGEPEKEQLPPPTADDENINNNIDPDEIAKIISQNSVPLQEDMNNNNTHEVIVEPLKKPENFKIPTRAQDGRLTPGRGPSYPIPAGRFQEPLRPLSRPPPEEFKVTVQNFDEQEDLERYEIQRIQQHQKQQQQQIAPQYEQPKRRSPKFGRRAPNPVEDYKIRSRTQVVEGNPNYVKEQRNEINTNRHQQSAYYHPQQQRQQQHQQPPPHRHQEQFNDSYRSNYEMDKQQNYRQTLGENKPFVVLDRQAPRESGVKPSTWMQRNWYDTN